MSDGRKEHIEMFFDFFTDYYEKDFEMRAKGFYMHHCDNDCNDGCGHDGKYVHATATVDPRGIFHER